MPTYRLIFPTPEGTAIENAETAMIDSGDMLYDVGAEIEHDRQALAGQPGARRRSGASRDSRPHGLAC
jgi:hypothetical protein